MTAQVWWYIARSSGIVTWALVTLAVIWGLLLSTRLTGGRPTPKWLLDLHRFLGGLSVVFLAVHVGALLLDTYVKFDLGAVLVPFASSWKPWQVALGVVGMYLLIAVEVTSLLMKHLPRKWWLRVHMLSFGVYWLSTLHGVTAGTDHRNPVLFGAYIVSAVMVLGLVVFRSTVGKRAVKRQPRRPQVPAESVPRRASSRV
jgi:predicted ferric reductase